MVPQGLTEIGITAHAIDAMLGELTMGAALHSVVVGEFPLSLDEAQDVLACHGLLGWPFGFDSEELEAMGGGEVDWGAGDLGRVLFKAENQRPSLYQKDVVDRFRSGVRFVLSATLLRLPSAGCMAARRRFADRWSLTRLSSVLHGV